MRIIYVCIFLSALCCPCISLSQESGGGASGPIFEPEALAGINVHNDLLGLQGVLYVYGVRSGFYAFSPENKLMAGFLYHTRKNDKAYTSEVNLRHSSRVAKIPTFLDLGAHVSLYQIKLDYKSDGSCVQQGCETDRGNYAGFFVGGGITLPFGAVPLRMSLRYYQSPSFWFLVDASVGTAF